LGEAQNKTELSEYGIKRLLFQGATSKD
jgi:hypothetical protein